MVEVTERVRVGYESLQKMWGSGRHWYTKVTDRDTGRSVHEKRSKEVGVSGTSGGKI